MFPFCSAHGVPESYIEAGDPYQRHIEECVRLISAEVSNQLSNDVTRPAGAHRCKEGIYAFSLLSFIPTLFFIISRVDSLKINLLKSSIDYDLIAPSV